MDETAFYCIVPYDLEDLEYRGVSFHWDGASRRWFLRFAQGGGDAGCVFNMTRSTVEGTRKAIMAQVHKMPKGGTVLVTQYAIDYEKDDVAGERFCPTDVHMLPFNDGENFNQDRRRRNEWCPSSADADWPKIDRKDRFTRLGEGDDEGG